MRVTSGTVSDRLVQDLARDLAAISRQQSLIASGKRIVVPADDPGGAAQAIAITSRQRAGEQFQRNIGVVRATLSSVDGTLKSALDAITRVRELAVQGANDSNDPLARQSLGQEIAQVLEGLVALANGRGATGGALFGGQETTRDPYVITRDATGLITAVAPNPRGIDGATPTEVADGLTVDTSVPGTTVFGATADPSNAFDVLIRLRDALIAGNGVAVRATLDDVSSALDRITVASTVVGSRLGWLDTVENRHKDETLTRARTLSTIQDLDYAAAIENLTQMQAFYQAGLAAGARILQQSLLDYLR